MNLIEAIKSGRPFRIKDMPHWFVRVEHDEMNYDDCGLEGVFLRRENGARASLHASDITSDDWEIQEPAVTLTRSQLQAVLLNTKISMVRAAGDGTYLAAWSVEEIARALGFPEEKGGGE